MSMNLNNDRAMKNIRLFAIIGIGACMALSCTKEETQGEVTSTGVVPMTFPAATASVTRTVLTNGTRVEWTAGDAISVIDGCSAAKDANFNHKFICGSIDAQGCGSFSGEASVSDVYYAAYPYDANDFITEEGKMRAALTSAQTASAPGTFGPNFNTAVATLRNGVFQFRNLGGLIKFTLTKDNVTKVTLTANDKGNIGGVFYIYFDENGDIDDARTTVASARTSLTLSPSGSATFAPGTYYIVAAARTYTGGISMSFTRNDGDPKTVTTTEDVIVGRSKVTNVGSFDTSVPVIEHVTPVTFPVVFPLGFPNGDNTQTGFCNSANEWALPWATDDACVSATRTTQSWSGYHGKMLCKDQNQAYVRWYWAEGIASTGVKYFIETANTASLLISTFGVKGVWTGDFFEITLPVKDFEAGTTLKLTMPIYTRSGPTFWEVLYKDGEEWKSTAVENLPAFEGSDVTRKATWAIPFGGAAASATIDTDQTVEMMFDNAIDEGTVTIRVRCVDGTVVSNAANSVSVVTKPANSSNNANAPFYFWNPGNKSSQSIKIENLGTI